MDKLYIEWSDFHKMVDQLSHQVLESGWQPDYVIGLTRGGLIPATILSHKLKCGMETLKVSLRDGGECEHNLWMPEDAAEGKNILIVDDLNDSGATINWIVKDWKDSMASVNWKPIWGSNVRVAVLYNSNDSKAQHNPEYYVQELKEPKPWIVFPWETK